MGTATKTTPNQVPDGAPNPVPVSSCRTGTAARHASDVQSASQAEGRRLPSERPERYNAAAVPPSLNAMGIWAVYFTRSSFSQKTESSTESPDFQEFYPPGAVTNGSLFHK
jgi:hypothetical protein